jgi:2-polyprenyl-3-methyl-5-hydroxy-6-metoxy-1,4-benzoquinol methylase
MNIIRRIVRNFGVDVVRYTAPESDATNHDANNFATQPRVISASLAAEALKSVGRSQAMPVHTYYERPDRSSGTMEQAENLWWNTHGRLIEKVWVLSEVVNHQYRKDYVAKGVEFLKQGNAKAKILDLGCGSGWFGRMAADENLEYHGMDFSSTQIEIANSEKEKSPNKAYLNYYCLTDFKQIKNLNEITGIVIHAFLHHLYWEELYNLFKELVTVLPDGCKFFIVEPIYPDKTEKIGTSQDVLNSMNNLRDGYRNYLKAIKKDLTAKNLFDTQTQTELDNIVSESTSNGFFFSPKEVPFRISEFTGFLNKYLHVDGIFHCGVVNIETAQFIDRIMSKEKQDYYSGLLFPFAKTLDQILLSNKYFEANQDTYLFTAFKCTLNKKVTEGNSHSN